MAIDEKLAAQVRDVLADVEGVREVKMFGSLGFMVQGNLVAAAGTRGLLVRVGDTGKDAAFARGAKPMVMNGREMKGFVWVEGRLDKRAVTSWVRAARAFVETLPPKKGARKAAVSARGSR